MMKLLTHSVPKRISESIPSATIVDKLKSELEHRIKKYEDVEKTFSVLTNVSPNMSNAQVSEGINKKSFTNTQMI